MNSMDVLRFIEKIEGVLDRMKRFNEIPTDNSSYSKFKNSFSPV